MLIQVLDNLLNMNLFDDDDDFEPSGSSLQSQTPSRGNSTAAGRLNNAVRKAKLSLRRNTSSDVARELGDRFPFASGPSRSGAGSVGRHSTSY